MKAIIQQPSLLGRQALSFAAVALCAAGVAAPAKAQQPAGAEMGRVISTVPVLRQVAVPQQVCNDESVWVDPGSAYPSGPTNGVGAAVGGLIGAAIGNQIGHGGGRAAATVLGALGGAMIGNQAEAQSSGGYASGSAYPQTVRRCTTQTRYEHQTVGYNVTYEYAGRQYTVQMPNDPGQWVPLRVTPSAYNSAPTPLLPPGFVDGAVVASPDVYYTAPSPVWVAPPVVQARPSVQLWIGASSHRRYRDDGYWQQPHPRDPRYFNPIPWHWR